MNVFWTLLLLSEQCYAKCTMQSMDVLEPSGEMNVDATIKRIGLATAPPEQIAMVGFSLATSNASD